MAENPIYKKNYELFLKNCPKFAPVFDTLKPSFWKICETGFFKIRNLKRTIEGKDYYLYSPENPFAEAEQWLNSIDLATTEVIVIYGVGLGYYYKVAKEWLRARPFRLILFVEDDLFLLRTFLELPEATDLLDDPQVLLLPIHPKYSTDEDFYNAVKKLLLKKVHITALREYSQRRSESYVLIQFKFEFYKHWLEVQHLEYLDYGRIFYSQFFRNVFKFPASYIFSDMKNYFKDIPAIVCGAGPSLSKQFDHLKELSDKAVIFGGGSAMNSLNAHNLYPHFGISVDPFTPQFTRLIMNTAFETPFIYTLRVNVEAFNAVHGPTFYVCNSGGYTTGAWLESKLGMSTELLDTGANVVNFSVSLAKHLGCNPIILIGQDLAYTGGVSYAPGIESHAIHKEKSTITTKSESEELIIHKDIYGKDTLTLWKWIAESYWFTMFSKQNPDLLINCTEGGIGFLNVQNIAFEEGINTYLTRSIDIHSLIHAAAQRNPPPEKITKENLAHILDDLRVNMIECLKMIDDHNAIDELPEELIKKLEVQDAYKALAGELLKKLDIFIDIIKEASENKIDPSIDQPTRVFFVNETFRHAAQYIKMALTSFAQQESIEKIPVKYEFPKNDLDIYHLKDKQVLIEDAELGLKFNSTLSSVEDLKWDSPKPWNGRLRLYDSAKNLILEEYYRDDKLNGPVTAYGESGQVLSRTWFIDGLRQGKAFFYYFNGQFNAREVYKDNQKEGVQVYFYPDGNLKSVIPYVNGLLDGTVKLYYPSGLIKREIQFSQGKRDGVDRYILPTGQKLFEAYYKNDTPSGSTKEWHENGALRKEIEFDESGEVETERRWSTQGEELDLEELEKEGFFEKMTKKIQILTDAIESVLLQVIQLSETLSKDPNSLPEMKAAVEQVKGELETLKGSTATMLELTGLKGDANKEQIWKSPAMRRTLDQQIALMSAKLRDAFTQMQSQVSFLKQYIQNENKR